MIETFHQSSELIVLTPQHRPRLNRKTPQIPTREHLEDIEQLMMIYTNEICYNPNSVTSIAAAAAINRKSDNLIATFEKANRSKAEDKFALRTTQNLLKMRQYSSEVDSVHPKLNMAISSMLNLVGDEE